MSQPIATYRVQLLPHLKQENLDETLNYLSELGVSHVYLSPCFAAAVGSTHGYDIVNFAAPLGMLGERGDQALGAALTQRGLSAVIDMVPNHMATRALENAWFCDVLERGARSPYFGYFDIDLSLDPHAKIVLPVLTAPLSRLLDQKRVTIEALGSRIVLRVPGSLLPVSVDSARALSPQEAALLSCDKSAMQAFVDSQHYRLVETDQGRFRINYRRYLDVNELIAVRVEDPEVFEAMHARVFEWLQQGWVSGIRVDHPDGLAHPAGYFERLRKAAPSAWILAEKPLRPAQKLPSSWPIDGTTGYDFLTLTMGLFVEPSGLRTLESYWAELTGSEAKCFAELAAEGKRWALREIFQAELARTAKAARQARGRADDPSDDITGALAALVVSLPVGRTQLAPTGPASAVDEHTLQLAAGLVRSSEPEHGDLALALVELLLKGSASASEFRQRFQQLSVAAAAKGVEDTAFFRFGALLSLCELGGDPDDAAFSVEDFHAHCAEVVAGRPRSQNTTSTHDTKRGEDARLRICALSEMPDAFRAAILRWDQLLGDAPPLDPTMRYHLYQTLVGVWPISEQRLLGYALKAARETKLFTSWLQRNPSYEEQVTVYVRKLLKCRAFIADLEHFLVPVLSLARRHSLGQLLLKLTAPGVPDIYQGSEVWEENLVDPDNRRPIDFAARRQLLKRVRFLNARQAWAERADGVPKAWLLARTLELRKKLCGAFVGPNATYEPLCAKGSFSDRIVAFVRGEQAITVVPRLLGAAPEGLHGTRVELPAGRWRDALSNGLYSGSVDCAELCSEFPVSLLRKEC